MRFRGLLTVIICLMAIAGCSKGGESKGVYMLLDTSGTYANELEKAQKIINYFIGMLQPGDSFAVATIDTGSFSEKDIIAKVRFDTRPSVSITQKRTFLDKINTFVTSVKGSSYTDITGGMLQAIEFLNEHNTQKKIIIVFSDMQEELAKGYVRIEKFDNNKLSGFNVIALNVTKLGGDIRDPRKYEERLKEWRKKVEDGGGDWRVINDLDNLDNIFSI